MAGSDLTMAIRTFLHGPITGEVVMTRRSGGHDQRGKVAVTTPRPRQRYAPYGDDGQAR